MPALFGGLNGLAGDAVAAAPEEAAPVSGATFSPRWRSFAFSCGETNWSLTGALLSTAPVAASTTTVRAPPASVVLLPVTLIW